MQKIFAFRLPDVSIGHPNAFYSWVNSHINPSTPVKETNISTKNLEDIFNRITAEKNRQIHNYDYVSAQFFVNDQQTFTYEQYTNWAMTHSSRCLVAEVREGLYKLTVVSTGLGYSIDSHLPIDIPLFSFYSKQWFDGKEYHIQFADNDSEFTSTELEIPINPFPLVDFDYQATKEVNKTNQQLAEEVALKIREVIPYEDVEDYVYRDLLSALEHSKEFRGGFYEPLNLRVSISSIPVKGGTIYFPFATFSFGTRFSQVLSPIFIPAFE